MMSDKLARWIARKLPRKVVYHCFMQIYIYSSAHCFVDRPDDYITFEGALMCWERTR